MARGREREPATGSGQKWGRKANRWSGKRAKYTGILDCLFDLAVGLFGMRERERLLLEAVKSGGGRQTVGAARELSTLDFRLFRLQNNEKSWTMTKCVLKVFNWKYSNRIPPPPQNTPQLNQPICQNWPIIWDALEKSSSSHVHCPCSEG